jgi:excisionase family DNA binding protein
MSAIIVRDKMVYSKGERYVRRGPMQPWLTLEQIAEELQIHVETVRNWVRDKKLPAYKVGRVYRVKRADFENFMAERRTTNESQ